MRRRLLYILLMFRLDHDRKCCLAMNSMSRSPLYEKAQAVVEAWDNCPYVPYVLETKLVDLRDELREIDQALATLDELRERLDKP
jgi:uncharacterized protein YfbU (UPF0304 family)